MGVQVPSDSFLQQAVPALEHIGVRMAYGQGMSTSSSGLSDIFNQVAVNNSAGDFCTVSNNVCLRAWYRACQAG